jgi:hypothetical protein
MRFGETNPRYRNATDVDAGTPTTAVARRGPCYSLLFTGAGKGIWSCIINGLGFCVPHYVPQIARCPPGAGSEGRLTLRKSSATLQCMTAILAVT